MIVDEMMFYRQLGIGRVRELTGEIVLSYVEVKVAIDYIASGTGITILGGDVLDAKDDYVYAFWNYDNDPTLSQIENSRLSCKKSLDYISSLGSKELCYYILVLDSPTPDS